jgi:hypothetical protein
MGSLVTEDVEEDAFSSITTSAFLHVFVSVARHLLQPPSAAVD